MSATIVERADRVEWVDFLRGLSALAVVLFHARVPLWVGWREVTSDARYSTVDQALAWLSLPFPFFGTAVMLFFLLSGFAIHYPHAGRRAFDPASYAARRLLRIYPAYVAAIALTMVAERCVAALTGVAVSDPALAFASAAMMQNYGPATQLHGNPSLWSLPVEAELYVAYPLLLWVWSRWGLRAGLMLTAAVSCAAAAALAFGHAWPLGNFAKYWIIWAAGAAIAERVRAGAVPRWRGGYGALLVAGLAAAVAARAGGLAVGYEHFLWAAIYLLIFVWGLNRSSPLERLPAVIRRSGLFLGRISYSLYLIHVPVLMIAGALWVATFGQKPSSFLVPVAASLLPIPVAFLLWRLVEEPSQSLGRTIARRLAPGTGTGRPASPEYVPALDGLRGAAIAAVMVFHANAPFLQGGFLGVDVFFVLSGFLITAQLVREFDARGSVSLPRFYMRRVLRLAPALCLLLVVYLMVVTVSAPENGNARHLVDAGLALFYVANWARAFDLHPPDFLAHTWSLSIEEQFYLVWPVLMVGLMWLVPSRRRVAGAILAIAAAAWSLRLWLLDAGAPIERLYNGTDTRADTLLIGAALAMWLSRRRAPVRGNGGIAYLPLAAPAAAVMLSAGLVLLPWRSPHYYAWGLVVAALASAVIVADVVVSPRSVLRSALSHPALVWVGSISYGLYLWHYPIDRAMFALGYSGLQVLTIGSVLTVAIAALSSWAVEAPFLQLKPRYAAVPPPAAAMSISASPSPVAAAGL